MASTVEKLKKIYELFSTEDHVLLPINADPDSIGSAMAVKRLLWRRVASVTISNINEIRRPDNLSMIRLLKINLIPFEQLNMQQFTKFVLVDSQPTHHPSLSKLEYTVIIDHHPVSGVNALFTDNRPNYGATCSIMTEYLKSAKITPSMKLATALFYGIKTDTSNFERHALAVDMKAFQFLFKYINITLARKIEFAEMTLDFLNYYKIALEHMHKRRNRVYVALGPVINPDVCVLIADFFMKIYGIDWTFIAGLYQENLIIIIRNNGIRKDAGFLANKRFGDIGSAGGHKSVARAEIPLDRLKNIVDYTSPKKLLRWIIRKTT